MEDLRNNAVFPIEQKNNIGLTQASKSSEELKSEYEEKLLQLQATVSNLQAQVKRKFKIFRNIFAVYFGFEKYRKIMT